MPPWPLSIVLMLPLCVPAVADAGSPATAAAIEKATAETDGTLEAARDAQQFPSVPSSPSSRDSIELPAQVTELPPELRARLHREVLTGNPSATDKFERLVRFVFEPQGLGMRYQEDATHSVARAYATRTANCVGFSLMFLALAREAGFEAKPQGVRHTLSWRHEDNTLYRNSHVNVRVRVDAREYAVDFAVAPVIAQHAPRLQSEQRLLAQYYNNLAMADLENQHMALAQRRMSIALNLDPSFPMLWSNAGVMHLRNGDTASAERAYARALALDPHDTGALFNMAGLARRIGDPRREREFQRRLSRAQRQDPLHHFLQALAYEQSGDDKRAIRHYRHAIRLYGGEPRFHAALAEAYRRVGDERLAIRAQARAEALREKRPGKTHAAAPQQR